MSYCMTYKILSEHLASGKLEPGEEIAIRIDQTLTQDATGTLAYLEFEQLGVGKVKTALSVSYVDHNTLQTGFENADDHRYLRSVAARYGIIFSGPGNGICHQVHLERFGVPGTTLLGSDSHTPTAGGLGAIGIGAGGLDVAAAMAGRPFRLVCPRVALANLKGNLPPWVSAKDIILEILSQVGVKGGVGKIVEYAGDGVLNLEVPQRATITNMGAELGATSSVFPSDEQTRSWLHVQNRDDAWTELSADPSAEYHELYDIDLSRLPPLIACPHSPDNVKPVEEVAGTKLNQVCVGSCTNSSYRDLMMLAAILKGRRVHPDISLTVSPGSRQVFTAISRKGALTDLIEAGARVLEVACGPCIGMGQAPPSGGVTLRTFNRNFRGRTGTKDASCYLSSVETAAASALTGEITDPRSLGDPPPVPHPRSLDVGDPLIEAPPKKAKSVVIVRGPNIRPLPTFARLEDDVTGAVLLQVGDNITTDDILPGGTKVLPLRSNIDAISEFTFSILDPDFVKRAKKAEAGFIVADANYGQGSSREHAALVCRFLGVRAVIAGSFSRIHRANLINFGVMPLLLADDKRCNRLKQGDRISLLDVRSGVKPGKGIGLVDMNRHLQCELTHDFTEREADVLLAGGLLNYLKKGG